MAVRGKKILTVLAFVSVIFVVLEQWIENGTDQVKYSTGSRQEFSVDQVLTDARGLQRVSSDRRAQKKPVKRILEIGEDDAQREEIRNVVEDVEKSETKGPVINKGGTSEEDRDVEAITVSERKNKSQQFQIPTSTTATSLFDDSSEIDASEVKKLRQSPYIYWPNVEEGKLRTPVVQNQTKYLAYLPYDIDAQSPTALRQCRYDNCKFVNNMSNADLVLFRASLVRDHSIPSFYRPKGQRWLMFTIDPAIKQYGLDRDGVGSNFNWTLTYQLSADLPYLFGRLLRRTLPGKDFEQLYRMKNRSVAWFVSHCPTWSKREDYVSSMQKFIDVDIFGRCGNLTCGVFHFRGNDSTVCLPMLTNHYKFYLSFENSFCKDYISEKFFKLFIHDVDVIPVVRGGFEYQKYLPSNMFVDAKDFESPEALAKYLRKLGDDKDKYIRMLKEKNKWTVAPRYNYLCTVCEALHTTNQTEHYHENLKQKFNGDPPECWQPTDL